MASYVYIMTNRARGVLYTGVTNDLIRRVYEHKKGLTEGFSKTYHLNLLVYYEAYDDIMLAIQREKNIKHWLRAWKIQLVESTNAEWNDLYQELI